MVWTLVNSVLIFCLFVSYLKQLNESVGYACECSWWCVNADVYGLCRSTNVLNMSCSPCAFDVQVVMRSFLSSLPTPQVQISGEIPQPYKTVSVVSTLSLWFTWLRRILIQRWLTVSNSVACSTFLIYRKNASFCFFISANHFNISLVFQF